MSDKEANDSGPKGAGIQVGAERADVAVEAARTPKGPLPGEIRGLHKDKLIKRPSSTRSGGPRTPAGRARAAENSLKHGAYIAQPRQSDVYHEKLLGVVQELKPLGEIAMTLCQDVAHELAKMQTLNAYERDQIYRAEHDGVSLMELSRRLDFPWAETHLDVLGTLHAQGVLRAQLLRAWRVLAKPPAPGSDGAPGEDLDLWARALKAVQGRVLTVRPAVREPRTPAAFCFAWAEVGQDKAKLNAQGKFSAAIPKVNLATLAV